MNTLRVATLNIWNRFGPWEERLEAIRAGVGALSPDILGLQEVVRLEPDDGDGLDQAAGLAEGGDFDVAILDMNLQGQTVESVAATLARRGKPFVFTTGYGERVIPPEFKDRPLLPKPYQIEQLGEILSRVTK